MTMKFKDWVKKYEKTFTVSFRQNDIFHENIAKRRLRKFEDPSVYRTRRDINKKQGGQQQQSQQKTRRTATATATATRRPTEGETGWETDKCIDDGFECSNTIRCCTECNYYGICGRTRQTITRTRTSSSNTRTRTT